MGIRRSWVRHRSSAAFEVQQRGPSDRSLGPSEDSETCGYCSKYVVTMLAPPVGMRASGVRSALDGSKTTTSPDCIATYARIGRLMFTAPRQVISVLLLVMQAHSE